MSLFWKTLSIDSLSLLRIVPSILYLVTYDNYKDYGFGFYMVVSKLYRILYSRQFYKLSLP